MEDGLEKFQRLWADNFLPTLHPPLRIINGQVLVHSGCYNKNIMDSVASTTIIYFSQFGAWEVQNQSTGR